MDDLQEDGRGQACLVRPYSRAANRRGERKTN
jgi:hypothetical protein